MTSALMEHSSVGSLLTARRQAREERRRQKRIVIFCNGDIFFKGKKLSITPNRYVSYNDLLQDLTYRMPQNLYLPNGVRQLFSPSSGHRLGSISDLRDGGAYVCAGNETFKPVKYGVAELLPWGKGAQSSSNFDSTIYAGGGGGAVGGASSSQFAGYNAFPPSRFLKKHHQPLQQQQLQLQQKQPPESSRIAALRGSHGHDDVSVGGDASSSIGVTRQPKVVTIVKDGPRPRQVVKILLNRRGVQSFQQLLSDISDSFGGSRRGGRLRRMWSIAGREVRDVGDLFREEELFVGSTGEEAMALDRVSDLLDELYPGNADVKSLLKHWERRLRRQEKRRGSRGHVPVPPPPRVEERDSGYEEAEGSASTPTAQAGAAAGAAPLRGEPLRHALAARRHSKPLPLIHEPQTAQPPPDPEEASRQQRLAEEQRLADEAASAKRDKQRRLGKQREAPVASKQQQQQNQQAKGRVVLPPIHASAKEPQPAPTSEKERRVAEKQSRKEKKTHQQQRQQEAEQQQSQPLPALPQIPADAVAIEKKSPQHQPKQQQQHSRKSTTPEPETPAARVLSPVREEEKEATHATAAAATAATSTEASIKDTAVTETPRRQETKKASQGEKSTDNAASLPASGREKLKKETQQQQQTPRKSASKKQQEKEKAQDKPEPPATDSQRPLIRPISSSRFINERFDLGKTMGDGNFAIVRACVKKESRNEYAMKVIDKSKLRGKEHMVINEVRIMKLCQHPNIVRLLEEYETRSEIYLVMELVKGGDLFDAISQVVKFNETQASHMVADMASALFYLHSRNVVHRDLKPENLLVYRSKDNKISLKLGDFGLAMEVDKPIYTVCGTPTYVAPEILEERGYGLEVDLWALGVITYILLCGFPPFRSRERRQTELFQFIKSGVFEFLSPYWDHISLSAKDLIQRLLVVDRRRRYTAVDVLCHPWVISLGGSKKLPPNLNMKEHQVKLREQLAKQAEEGMAEFLQVKASSIYGVQASAK